MTFDLPIAERRLKSTARVMHQSMWLLFLIAAGLMLIVRRSAALRNGSLWILGFAVLTFMLSYALRDVLRKLGRRNAEDQIVKDVKTFLQKQVATPAALPAPAKPAVAQAPSQGDGFVACRKADFVGMKDAMPVAPQPDLVVFDAFPARDGAMFRAQFHAILQPVVLQ